MIAVQIASSTVKQNEKKAIVKLNPKINGF
jgi:hypothetical protein